MVFISGPFVRAHAMLQPPSPHAPVCTQLGDPPSPRPACVLNACPLSSFCYPTKYGEPRPFLFFDPCLCHKEMVSKAEGVFLWIRFENKYRLLHSYRFSTSKKCAIWFGQFPISGHARLSKAPCQYMVTCDLLTHLFEGVNLNTFCLPIPRKKPLALPEFESITLFSGFVELPRKTHFQS